MKILLATVYPLPGGGGIWSFVSNLRAEFERKGHTVDVLSTDEKSTKIKILNSSTEVEFDQYQEAVSLNLQKTYPGLLPNSFIYFWEKHRYLYQAAVSELSLETYDIIHAQDITAALAFSAIKPAGVPLVTSVNGYFSGEIFFHLKTLHPDRSNEQLWSTPELVYCQEFERQGCQASGRLHAASNWLTRILTDKYSVPLAKIHTFAYGIDLERLQKKGPAAPAKNEGDKKIILCMGRLVYLKGIGHLIDALSHLNKERKDWECWILGEGDMGELLKKQCEELGVRDKVKFKGFVKNVVPILQQADILVHPSLQETLPHTVIEAQAAGIPVIVSDAASMPEMVIHGETGLVFPHGNSEVLYTQISTLLKSPQMREELRMKALERGKHYWDSGRMIANMEDFYQEAIQENKDG
ncbi:glycosyltransferase family 4 protein [Rossellomorea vietnamensis]|uniref:Glycosyltransferase family 4 protein n=1 Tax=Rossellomorea vietnamensis TaxID=218284 RepID=A0A5D4NNI5_9BACI|nr:glycosyltransferase family 4 protein [Rossellomorea vietnamensis]TYS15204.1 glycosyltransferase family 4 protein [Rossellomorea vietnamensis]